MRSRTPARSRRILAMKSSPAAPAPARTGSGRVHSEASLFRKTEFIKARRQSQTALVQLRGKGRRLEQRMRLSSAGFRIWVTEKPRIRIRKKSAQREIRARLRLLKRERSLEHANGCTADARDQFLSLGGNFDFDLARTAHLHTLQDVECVPWSQLAVFDEVCTERTSR